MARRLGHGDVDRDDELEGVERLFPVMSPMIESIEVKRRGVVRRAKLYYLRDRRGKSARIAERAMGSRETAPAATED